jgi:hypothetical protein
MMSNVMTDIAAQGSQGRSRQAADDLFTHRLCAWTGPFAVILSLLGMVIIGGYIPATNPAASGAEIARFYTDNLGSVRIGMIISMIGFTLFIPFGIGIAMQTRRIEQTPVMTYVQIASVAVSALEGVMATCIWLTAAFRPDEINPELTRALHDMGWIVFLVDVPPFSVWMIAIGIAILRDRGAIPLFPRWLGFFNFWVALLILPALLLPFFKSGPFAYSGILALYLPFGAFFTWMVVMTFGLFRAIDTK